MERIVLGLGCALPLHPLSSSRALLLLQPLLLLMPLFLLLQPPAGMIRGFGLLRHLLLIRDHPGGPHLQPGPGLRTRVSNLVRGHKSPIPHQFKVQLMTYPRICPLLLLSGAPSSIIRCPFFHRGTITGNSDRSTREVHCETYYNFSAFAADPELRDSLRLVQWYSLEPFMTPRWFFYPRVVIEFYHTMTSRRVPHPTVIHFSIDGHEGTLQAADIAAVFHFLTVLANSADYRLWPHPLPREMVRILSREVTTRSIIFRRQLPPSMLLIDHILRSNLYPLQHTVQQRGAILEALYHISEGFWFSPAELFMTSLFHFEDKVHCKNLT